MSQTLHGLQAKSDIECLSGDTRKLSLTTVNFSRLTQINWLLNSEDSK